MSRETEKQLERIARALEKQDDQMDSIMKRVLELAETQAEAMRVQVETYQQRNDDLRRIKQEYEVAKSQYEEQAKLADEARENAEAASERLAKKTAALEH